MNKFLLIIFILLLQLNATASTTQSVNEVNKNTVVDWSQIIRSIALIYTDDKLDPEVEKFLNYKPEVIWEDNAYVYLWGMDIKTDKPYETGREILEKLVAENKLYNYEQHPLDLSFLDNYVSYDKPESDLLCKKHKPDCIEKIVNNHQESQLLLSKHQFYIDRYLTFLNFKHFKQIEGRRMESPIPSYRILITAQKLYHISLLMKLQENPEFNIVVSLKKELNKLKKQLEQIDTIIGKMIVLVLVNENLELFNYLHQTNKVDLNSEITLFKPLKDSERSIYNAMFEEHSRNLKLLYEQILDVERLNKKKYKRSTVQLMRLIYFLLAKPNLTANTIYNDNIKKYLTATQLPTIQHYKTIKTTDLNIYHDPIRNYLVYSILGKAQPEHMSYQFRAFDIDMKLQLMRLIIHSQSIDNLKIDNDYLSSYDQTPPFKKENKLCYSGIAKMFPEFRCLNIY